MEVPGRSPSAAPVRMSSSATGEDVDRTRVPRGESREWCLHQIRSEQNSEGEQVSSVPQAGHAATPSADDYSRAAPWAGSIAFAAVCMVVLGSLHLLEGMIALVDSDKFPVAGQGSTNMDLSARAWVHLVGGVILLVSGLCVFGGQTWPSARRGGRRRQRGRQPRAHRPCFRHQALTGSSETGDARPQRRCLGSDRGGLQDPLSESSRRSA